MSDGKYRMPAKTVKLAFPPDSEYAGAWVRVLKKPDTSMMILIQDMMTESRTAEQIMFFAEHIGRGWNLQETITDDNGDDTIDPDTGEVMVRDIPYTPEEFIKQPFDFTLTVLRQWAEVAGLTVQREGELDPNSTAPSSDGLPLAAEPTPTPDAPSESPLN